MLEAHRFFELLVKQDIRFFSGVPDSLLKDFCAYLADHVPPREHIISASEGGAVALGMGYHLSTGEIPLIYLQNSGLGNIVNPILSLADPEVYSIPMLLLIGWRGEPGVKDEPQHKKQGRVMIPLLQAMEIPYAILPSEITEAGDILSEAVSHFNRSGGPFALVVRKETFQPYSLQKKTDTPFPMVREEAIQRVVDCLEPNSVVVATTGMASRELFEHRENQNAGHNRDFLTVGGMGHASHIALGIALQQQDRQVYCIDGDGAVLMHMGSLAINGLSPCTNFKHILINNGAHDSVGGQATAGLDIDFQTIARSCGYRITLKAETAEAVSQGMEELNGSPGPALLEILVRKGARKNLGRPTTTPIENKQSFMKFLR
ncbi:MAG: phosphonopyruvate decarboxylase [Nitrospinae bacterium CG11_big_fil_rev_8_21_14_0_20_56_8]|nr:MAG: phosphonopyruvate decarboxylase [Nitrospinae bacterium CG11_big_fil_rev_8_21_14_0_20_56_8]